MNRSRGFRGRSRGNFGGVGGGGGPSGINDGPLLTSHLRELDRELHLIKRKRELYEQEHQLLDRYSSNNMRQYGNNQQSQQYSDEQYDYYSNAYAPGGSNMRPQSMKRQNNPVWQNNEPSPPKRFNDVHRLNPWGTERPQNSNYNPPQHKGYTPAPRPLMAPKPSIAERIRNRYVPPTAPKNFNPTKVTKPTPKPAYKPINKYPNTPTIKPANAAANKPAYNPAAETQQLIQETNKMIDHTNKITGRKPYPKKPEVDNVLRPYRQPSVQMKGRLELALGMIIKRVRELCPNARISEFLKMPFIQRVVKHTLRVRIRNVMMNLPIESVNDIVLMYRQKYPKDTDVELMNIAQEAYNFTNKNRRIIQLADADTPEDFIRRNMSSVMYNKLDQIFSDIRKLYENKEYNLEKHVELFPKETNFATDIDVEKEKDQSNANGQKQKHIYEGCSTDVKSITCQLEEKSVKVKNYCDFMEKQIEMKLPKILPKFKDELLTLVCCDKECLGIKALIMSELKQKIKKQMGVVDENVITIDDEEEKRPTNSDAGNTSTAENSEPVPTSAAETVLDTEVPSAAATEEVTDTTTPEAAVEVAETAATPAKPTPSTASSVKPAAASPAQPTTPATPAKNDAKTVPSTPKTPASKEIRYVKLIGQPSLPARAVIYEFLNKFNPTSIKKHKSINNLLVVGFVDKEAFENILNANETVVGDSTLIIKASEQVNTPVQKKTNENNKTAVLSEDVNKNAEKDEKDKTDAEKDNSEDKLPGDGNTDSDDTLNKTEPLDNIIPSDIDNQITDLLSSIRNADEALEKSNEQTENTEKSDAKSEVTNEQKDGEENTIDQQKGGEENTIDQRKSSEENTTGQQKGGEENTTEISNDGKKDLETVMEVDIETEKSNKNVEATKANSKESGRATPTRSSSRLATVTPSTIKTRRASRLANN